MTRTSCIRLLQMDAVVGDFDANLRKLADAAELRVRMVCQS